MRALPTVKDRPFVASPYRSEAFYRSIPDALRRLKVGDIPDDQLGRFNISDTFLDWGDAKALYNQGRLRNKPSGASVW